MKYRYRLDSEMKDSGVEWLGRIPKEWEVTRLKYELLFLNYKRIPLSSGERGKMVNTKYDYYGASGIIDKVDNYIFDGKYILIGEDGANLYSRSTALVFLASGKFWVNNHAHILKSKNNLDDYYVNLLESIDYTNLITGSAQPKLTQDNLANVKICKPNNNEQQKIADFLDIKTKKIDLTIEKIKKEIEKLKEAKKSLISEAVTGKIEVL